MCVRHKKRRYPKLSLSCSCACGKSRPFAYFSAARLAALVLCGIFFMRTACWALRYANTGVLCSRRILPCVPENPARFFLIPRDWEVHYSEGPLLLWSTQVLHYGSFLLKRNQVEQKVTTACSTIMTKFRPCRCSLVHNHRKTCSGT